MGCTEDNDVMLPRLYQTNSYSWDGTTLSTTTPVNLDINFGSAPFTLSRTSNSMTMQALDRRDSDLGVMKIPTSTENFYYKCWSRLNNTALIDYNSPLSDISTGATLVDIAVERSPPVATPPVSIPSTPSTASTSTPTSTSRAEVVAILAAAGSGLASMLF